MRAQVEAELHAARVASEELDALLRERDSRRAALDEQVESARAALDEARLAAQQIRVRRESVAEQLAATTFELADLHRRARAEATGRPGKRRWRRPRARSSASAR